MDNNIEYTVHATMATNTGTYQLWYEIAMWVQSTIATNTGTYTTMEKNCHNDAVLIMYTNPMAISKRI